MTCPKCGNEQPDVFSQCQKCRYIFPRQSANSSTDANSPVSLPVPASKPSLSAFFGALAVLLALSAGLWWLHTPEGLPLPEDPYTNEKHHFAVSVPNGWMVLTPDNYQEMFQKLGDKLPKSLQDGLSQRRIEAGFIKLLQEPDFSPSMNVVVMETEMPELDESQMEEASRVLSAQFKRVLESYKLEKTELVTVDELTSMHFSSRAGLKLKVADSQPGYVQTLPSGRTRTVATPEHWRTFDLKMTQTLVPGKKRAYIITCTSEAQQYEEYKRTFEKSIDSFRVLQRPARYGPIVMGALQGGLLAAIAYLLYFVIVSLIAFIKG
ncbi:MAG: hypothetical protein Q8P51_19500 [Ignavibacteria bacterium]|nr:hypothetical protein [Ignavibacteria bacterium]